MTTTPVRYDYNLACASLQWIIDDVRVLAGDTVGSAELTWQDVARNLASNLRQYADLLEAAADGNVRRGPVVFPSLDDVR